MSPKYQIWIECWKASRDAELALLERWAARCRNGFIEPDQALVDRAKALNDQARSAFDDWVADSQRAIERLQHEMEGAELALRLTKSCAKKIDFA